MMPAPVEMSPSLPAGEPESSGAESSSAEPTAT
jgi:hypothetical protein